MVPDPDMIYKKKRIRHHLRTIYFADDSDDDLAANGILDIGLTVHEELMQMAFSTEFVPTHLFPILQPGGLHDNSLSTIDEESETDEEFISDSLADSCEGNICYPSEESCNEVADEEVEVEYMSPMEEHDDEFEIEITETSVNNPEEERRVKINFRLCDPDYNPLLRPQAGEDSMEEDD